MRCTCCDRMLNDYESTRKSRSTGEYLDMCNKCYGEIQKDLASDERSDLEPFDVPDEELEFSPEDSDSEDWE